MTILSEKKYIENADEDSPPAIYERQFGRASTSLLGCAVFFPWSLSSSKDWWIWTNDRWIRRTFRRPTPFRCRWSAPHPTAKIHLWPLLVDDHLPPILRNQTTTGRWAAESSVRRSACTRGKRKDELRSDLDPKPDAYSDPSQIQIQLFWDEPRR